MWITWSRRPCVMGGVNEKFGFILDTKTSSSLVKLSLLYLLTEFNLCDKLYLIYIEIS